MRFGLATSPAIAPGGGPVASLGVHGRSNPPLPPSLLESLRILDSTQGKSFEDLMMKNFGLSVSSSGSHGFWLLAYFGHCKFGLSGDSPGFCFNPVLVAFRIFLILNMLLLAFGSHVKSLAIKFAISKFLNISHSRSFFIMEKWRS
jgi:hypothetical protein